MHHYIHMPKVMSLGSIVNRHLTHPSLISLDRSSKYAFHLSPMTFPHEKHRTGMIWRKKAYEHLVQMRRKTKSACHCDGLKCRRISQLIAESAEFDSDRTSSGHPANGTKPQAHFAKLLALILNNLKQKILCVCTDVLSCCIVCNEHRCYRSRPFSIAYMEYLGTHVPYRNSQPSNNSAAVDFSEIRYLWSTLNEKWNLLY